VEDVAHASRFAVFDGNPAGPLDVDRAAGADRVATAIALSQAGFTAADAVVVATAANFPDALAAAPLAGAAGGPILLTGPGGLDAAVAAEIGRLGATTAYVMGGTVALSDQVLADLQALPVLTAVSRVAGPDRFATAAAAAHRAVGLWRLAGDADAGADVIVALGAHPTDDNRAWPDALAAGPLAVHAHRPILLTAQDGVPEATITALAELGVTRATVVGGPVAIPETTAAGLGVAATDRIGGADRYDTSVLLAEAARAVGATDREVVVATGLNWPDGLAAGPVASARGGVLVLAARDDLDQSAATADWLADHLDVTRWVRVAGGAVALTDTTYTAIQTALGR
jgi:putative cell wall-binding protein